MEISPIKNDADLLAALAEVDQLVDANPTPDSPAFDKLEVLVTLIESYEAKHHALGPTSPIEAIRFRMDQAQLTVQDLVPFIGATNRVYEVLSGSRPLTLRMIRNLNRGFGIPLESLIGVGAATEAQAPTAGAA